MSEAFYLGSETLGKDRRAKEERGGRFFLNYVVIICWSNSCFLSLSLLHVLHCQLITQGYIIETELGNGCECQSLPEGWVMGDRSDQQQGRIDWTFVATCLRWFFIFYRGAVGLITIKPPLGECVFSTTLSKSKLAETNEGTYEDCTSWLLRNLWRTMQKHTKVVQFYSSIEIQDITITLKLYIDI